MNLAEKLVEVRKQVGYLQKQGSNTAQGYKYARAQDVFLKVNDAMGKLGVANYGSHVAVLSEMDGLGKSGNQHRASVRISVTYRDTESGDEVTFEGAGSGQDSGDKAIAKANTMALKYLLTNAFHISWGDDPEADPVTDEEGRVVEGAKPATKKTKKPSSAAAQKKLLADIEACTTEEELNAQRDRVLKLDNQTPEYKAARDAVMAKRAALRQTTIPGT